MIRTYHEMSKFDSFAERLEYLQLTNEKHSSPRQVSNSFYKSPAWMAVRARVIERDYNSDLGILGMGIDGNIIVHHMNALVERDILEWDEEKLLNPDYLISVSYDTHNKIHYGLHEYKVYDERKPGDTKLW